jgi:hypothetical protein
MEGGTDVFELTDAVGLWLQPSRELPNFISQKTSLGC